MNKIWIPLFFVIFLDIKPLYACDACSIYSSEKVQGELTEGVTTITPPSLGLVRTGIVEQFTYFGTIKDGGRKVSNDTGQYLNSSITQLFLAYQITQAFSFQANFPLINRTYQRPNGFSTDRGSESGIGDASLLGQWAVHQDYNFSWNLFGGLKLPTGNASRIAEELSETDSNNEAPASAIHGHDLALGTGSYDIIIGTNGRVHSGRFILPANIQYAIRTLGSYGYRYADDFAWQLVPGYYALLQPTYSGILGVSISGELKGNDTFRGNVASDTGTSAIYLGPQISLTVGEKMSAMVGFDLPVLQNETSLQIVPDTRIKALFSAQL